MSRIYFHTPDETVWVSGAERAHFGNIISDIALAFLRPSQFDSTLREASPEWVRRSRMDFDRVFRMYWRTAANEPLHLPNGRSIDPWTTSLNTVIALGSDPLTLAARIHGQCEVHGYVEGSNVGWFRGLIERGIASGVLRSGEGWDRVVELVDRSWPSSNPPPIVMSYIVCDSFPNPEVAGWRPDSDEAREAFYELGVGEQWRMAMKGLRERDVRCRLEMSPNDWSTYWFGDKMTAMGLRETVDRIDQTGDDERGG